MGLGDLTPDDVRLAPPYGAHPALYNSVDDVVGPEFRRGPDGEPADTRRDDYLLGAALFMDVPKAEHEKTRLYFAASMIARAPNRDVQTQTAPINNYTAFLDGEAVEESDEYDTQVGVIADAFCHVEEAIEEQIRGTDTDRSEVVLETLDGVRTGQSFFARWGNARPEDRDSARDQGTGKFGL